MNVLSVTHAGSQLYSSALARMGEGGGGAQRRGSRRGEAAADVPPCSALTSC